MTSNRDGIEIISDLRIDTCSKNKIQIRSVNSRKHMYISASYDNNTICYDDSKNGLYRSVLLSYPDKKVLSFAIPKTMQFQHFRNIYPDWNEHFHVSEYIDGIPIQLFYDSRIMQWEIAIQDSIGGYHSHYHNNISFSPRKKFIDALGGRAGDDLENLPFLEYLPNNVSYSFVLKYTGCRSETYLVGAYSIGISDVNSIAYIALSEVETWIELTDILGLIQFPKTIPVFGYFDLSEKVLEFDPIKWVITNNTTGMRSIVQNGETKYNEDTCKIPAHQQYLYQCLYRIGSLNEHLDKFPKQKSDLYLARDLFKQFVSNVDNAYRNYYIKKCALILPAKYKMHAMNIHKRVYLPSLRNKTPTLINRERICEYFQQMDPREIVYFMRR